MCWICSFKPVITVLPYLVGDTGSIPHSAVTFQNDFSNAYNWWVDLVDFPQTLPGIRSFEPLEASTRPSCAELGLQGPARWGEG